MSKISIVESVRHNLFPDYSHSEWLVDFCIHVLGLVTASIAVPVLLIWGSETAEADVIVALALYAAGLVAMLTFSALYNIVQEPEIKEILRRFDHAAIFLMIAGSYSPFALVKIEGAWGTGLFIFVWVLAVLGVALAVIFPRKVDRALLILCLLMGWSIVVALEPLIASVTTDVSVLLLIGGVLYTVGVGFHLSHGLRYHNAIWHACVLAAAGCHYVAILNTFVP